jgi:hypothetical protein
MLALKDFNFVAQLEPAAPASRILSVVSILKGMDPLLQGDDVFLHDVLPKKPLAGFNHLNPVSHIYQARRARQRYEMQ